MSVDDPGVSIKSDRRREEFRFYQGLSLENEVVINSWTPAVCLMI